MTINGVYYKVEYVSDLYMSLLPGCDETTLGNIDYHKAVISIKDSLQPNQQRKTLIHEVTHAIRHEYGFRIEENEEVICDFIGAFADEILGLVNNKEETE